MVWHLSQKVLLVKDTSEIPTKNYTSNVAGLDSISEP
jgi:hypothetical protein